MFKAIVLACVIGAPDNCIEFHSIIYSETRQLCRSRAFEMSRDIGEIANLMPKQWRCQLLKEGQLSWNLSAPHWLA
jgi:hypothetical protein